MLGTKHKGAKINKIKIFFFQKKIKSINKYLCFFNKGTTLMKSVFQRRSLQQRKVIQKTLKKKGDKYFKNRLLKKYKFKDIIVKMAYQNKRYDIYHRKDSKFTCSFMHHFLATLLKCGRGHYLDNMYRSLLIMNKVQSMNSFLNLYKIISFLQFFLLLKGHRYKVGRGVIKYRYSLMPVSIVRQFYLSFFYFQQGVKRNREQVYLDKVFGEYFNLLQGERNNAIPLIANLYELAYQSRMFIPRKRYIIKKKLFKRKVRYRFLFKGTLLSTGKKKFFFRGKLFCIKKRKIRKKIN